MLGHVLQVLFFSATLHSDAVKQSIEKLCHNPTWVDLKVQSPAHELDHLSATAMELSCCAALMHMQAYLRHRLCCCF